MTKGSGLSAALIALLFASSFGPRAAAPQSSQGSEKPAQRALDCAKRATTKHVKYRIARRTRTSYGWLFLHISVPNDDFNSQALLTLPCQLTSNWSNQPKQLASICNNDED